MGLEPCPECDHLTKVYRDAGNRLHNPGCSLASEPVTGLAVADPLATKSVIRPAPLDPNHSANPNDWTDASLGADGDGPERRLPNA